MLQKNEEAGLSPCLPADNINNKGNIFLFKISFKCYKGKLVTRIERRKKGLTKTEDMANNKTKMTDLRIIREGR